MSVVLLNKAFTKFKSFFCELIPYGGMPCSALSAREKGLVLPQLNGPGFADFPWEPLTFGKSEWEGAVRGARRVGEEGWEGELWLECKMKF